MKAKIIFAVVAAGCLLAAVTPARAATTINAANKYAYAANLGWVDARGDTANGAVIDEYVCSGSIYSANVGWINLGSGTPANGIQYQNSSATDYGVNTDSLGNLRGYAYGANIGWINFEATGAPKINLFNGNLSGSVWSANCGWISLSNATAFVQTDSIQKGALSTNGLPIAWLLQNFGTTNVNANADADGDGVSNGNEYLAGTDPNNANSSFRIISIIRDQGGNFTTLNWSVVNTRYYAIQTNSSLSVGTFGDFYAPQLLGFSGQFFFDAAPTNRFYRIRAYRPLTP